MGIVLFLKHLGCLENAWLFLRGLRCSGMVDGWGLGALGDLWQWQVESGGIPWDVSYGWDMMWELGVHTSETASEGVGMGSSWNSLVPSKGMKPPLQSCPHPGAWPMTPMNFPARKVIPGLCHPFILLPHLLFSPFSQRCRNCLGKFSHACARKNGKSGCWSTVVQPLLDTAPAPARNSQEPQ